MLLSIKTNKQTKPNSCISVSQFHLRTRLSYAPFTHKAMISFGKVQVGRKRNMVLPEGHSDKTGRPALQYTSLNASAPTQMTASLKLWGLMSFFNYW